MVYSTRRFVVLPCVILFLCFLSHYSIAITSFEEERANISAFRTFVRFVLVWICRFPLPLGVWERLRFVTVALPGLFSYYFSEYVHIFLELSSHYFYQLFRAFFFFFFFFHVRLLLKEIPCGRNSAYKLLPIIVKLHTCSTKSVDVRVRVDLGL